MRLFAAVLLGKTILFLTKYFKIGGGSAAPGLYALKLCPSLVEKISHHIPKNIVITGTNGKTTTAKMLAHFAKASGLRVIRNHTGSNLERGIASTLISKVNLWNPKLSFDLGIWELDEAAFNTVTPKLNPNSIVFLNIFRDQLDRYGEIDSVVKKWEQSVKSLPADTKFFLNGDDANVSKLAKAFKGKAQKFGVENYKIYGEAVAKVKKQENVDFEAKNVKLNGLNSSKFTLTIFDKRYAITLPLPGIYHIYDYLAAFAAGISLGFKPGVMNGSLKNFSPAFGRVEKHDFGYIFLIKNPAGATQVFETIAPQINPDDRLLLALNDNLADGTDVSWIWDVDFELIQNSSRAKSRDHTIVVSGTRSYDLALRLKYAGIKPDQITVEQDLKNALKRAMDGLEGRLFILPTYTSMLELQSILTKEGIKKHYWKESD